MKKNDGKDLPEKRLVWKLKDKPSAEGVAMLVEHGVLSKEEAREIILREVTEDTDEVKALKEMVETLQEMVRDLLSRPNIQLVPYTKVIEVPRRLTPYWERYWTAGSTAGDMVNMSSSSSGTTGNTTYTLSIG